MVRGNKKKVYIVVYVCMLYRMVMYEYVRETHDDNGNNV